MNFIYEYPLIYIATFVAILLVLVNILSDRKKPTSITAWLLLVVLFPYMGIILYIIFHDRKLKYTLSKIEDLEIENLNNRDILDSDLANFIYKNSGIIATSNSSFYLCKDADESYLKLIDMLKGAKNSIYIASYIFGKDEVTKEIVEILAKKAKEGIEVKLLVDALGSWMLEIDESFLEPLKESGAEYRFFMSLIKKPFSSKLNLRNHRKMIVVDHTIVMSGGINISKEYLNSTIDNATFKDISFIIDGDIATQYEEIFLHDWSIDEDSQINSNSKRNFNYQKGDSIIGTLPSGPDLGQDTLFEALTYAIYQAKKRVWIISPYFAPDTSLMDALIIAKHRGVEVKIVSPRSSDHFFVDIVRDAFLRELQDEGVEIVLYQKRMLHAKAVLIDDSYAFLGSANFDTRSMFYNFEVVSLLYAKSDIEQVKRWIEGLFGDAKVGLKEASRARMIVEKFFKIFAPAI